MEKFRFPKSIVYLGRVHNLVKMGGRRDRWWLSMSQRISASG